MEVNNRYRRYAFLNVITYVSYDIFISIESKYKAGKFSNGTSEINRIGIEEPEDSFARSINRKEKQS